jgi:phospholipase C
MLTRTVGLSHVTLAVFLTLALGRFGCSSQTTFPDASAQDASNMATPDAATDAGIVPPDGGVDASVGCSGPCPQSAVKYLVVIVQENHTFDNHFGRYCTAATGSNPTCNTGPACCEAGPAMDPSGASPKVLNDSTNGSWDPFHTRIAETEEMDDGGMDHYVTGGGIFSNANNFSYADPTIIQPYWTLAGKYAIADRYFQSVIGASSANDMYLARSAWEFDDNDDGPANAIGITCNTYPMYSSYTHASLGDLLVHAGVPWTFFAAGYDAMKTAVAAGSCPTPPADCPAAVNTYPCTYDPGDDPFLHYPTLEDIPQFMADLDAFTADLSSGTLPAVSYIKGPGYKTEHPGTGDTLTAGVTFTTGLVNQILSSQYGGSVLILILWDESGGYFDHISPPAPNTADGQPYGPRLPVLAIGPFVKTNYVSHVFMEHSSVLKFVEWNWLGSTGQLSGDAGTPITRDTNANNIGDLLDPTKTGVAVPVH